MKVFVDTNIFLDLILKREGYDNALLILNAIEKRIFSGAILDITLLNIDYIANKQVKNIREFLALVNSLFEVIGATNKIFDDALNLPNNDLEDNVQYLAAKALACDVIITNDKAFFAEGIEKVTSQVFVDRFLGTER